MAPLVGKASGDRGAITNVLPEGFQQSFQVWN